MITIKLNKKKTKIPTMNELTVKQFIELSRKELNVINYLSVVLGINYKEAFNSKAKGIDKLLLRLGTLEDYATIKPDYVFSIDNKVYNTNNIRIDTVGQRYQIEMHAKKLENEGLLCFILSIAIVDDPMDIDQVYSMRDKLMNESYKKILPIAFFLANRFLNGRKSAMNYLKMSRRLINMKLREIRLALTG